MVQGTSLFLLGVLAFQRLPELPSIYWGLLLPLAAAFGCFRPALRLPAWFVAGFLWALLCAHSILASGLPAGLEGRDVVVEGVIATIPEQRSHGVRFQFQVERLLPQGRDEPAELGRVRLSWYTRAPELHAGERWRLTVRLKRPHGMMNPGGFDYEAWLYANRLRATGYVRDAAGNQRLAGAADFPVTRLREDLGRRLRVALAGQAMGGIVTALAIGDRQGITGAQWEVLTRTGTNHLVAISGLHIGLVAGLVYWSVLRLWPRLGRLALRLPAPQAAAVWALAAAAGYAALAGFSVPTQRALIMVTVAMAAVLLRRRRAYLQTLAAALLFVLIYDPLAVMSGGFWLSFTAVAVILFGMSCRIGGAHWWWRFGRLHVLVAIGLLPVMLALFRQVPLIGPVANFLAVPWVSFVVVPPTLCGALLLPLWPALGGLLLQIAAALLALLWVPLQALAGLGLQWMQPSPPAWTLVPAALGVFLLCAPRGVPGRWLGILWLLPALCTVPPRPAAGELQFTLLDVGQGLAAVARTHDHVLVYDTGARFSDELDAGSAVLVPFLRNYGITTVDMLVIGHGDNDHIGGARALLESVIVRRVISSVPDRIPGGGAEPCTLGQSWRWDGVRFDILHPGADGGFAGNDASCVLRIDSGAARVLLTGDIERPAEAHLLDVRPQAVAASILVAPHHGSKSSSSPDFVRAVHPDYVLFPVGYRNRWGFPKDSVTARYRGIGAQLYDTAHAGAISFTLPARGPLSPPSTYRQSEQRYWRGR